jgi:phosphate transport system permease protein
MAVTASSGAATRTASEVAQRLRRRAFDPGSRTFEVVLLASLIFALLVLVTLLFDVVRDGAVVFAERGVRFLTARLSSLPRTAGVSQGIEGSLLLSVFVAIFSFPLGIGAAVYLEEYARDTRLTRFIRVNIRNLAGVPSIVYGLLGLAIFVNLLFQRKQTLLAGALTLSVLVLPIVIITASEALRAVPYAIREAAYGVGATRWEVIRHHVLPYAAPGILTGTVLSLARAAGETAPLILVGAASGFFTNPGGFLDKLTSKFAALPVTIFVWSKNPNADFRELTAAAIIVLLAVILLVNAVAIILRNRYERKW